jgi:acyl-CoA thioester hydrolase
MHEINYLGAAKLGDQLLLTTYTGEYTGAGCWRHFSIRQNTGTQELVVAKTLFVLLNKASGKPQRIGTEVVQIFIDAV